VPNNIHTGVIRSSQQPLPAMLFSNMSGNRLLSTQSSPALITTCTQNWLAATQPVHFAFITPAQTITNSRQTLSVTRCCVRLHNHHDDVQDVHVILSVEKLRQKAEATVNMKGTQLFADTIDADMYAAIDLLTDKLDRQLIKHKEKVKDHHRKDKDKIQVESDLD